MDNEVNSNTNSELNVKSNNNSKIVIIILAVLLVGALGFICYDKFINTEKPPVPTPVVTPTEDQEDGITSLRKIEITDKNQVVSVAGNEYRIKKEITVDGAFLLINDNVRELENMETVYADFAYVTNKYIIFTLIGQDGEIISYAMDKDGNKISIDDNKYQMNNLKINNGILQARGHIFCGLDGDCPDKDLIIQYENNVITVNLKK